MVDVVGIASITILFVLLLLGIPVFVSMAGAALAGFLLTEDPAQTLASLSQIVWQSSLIFELVAIPLFIFAGLLMEKTGAGDALLQVTKAWVGGVPNSLGVATIFACGIFAAISGSSIATAATIGVVSIPLLLGENYSRSQAGGLVAGGGTLGIIIPPSIPLILYGVITETSVGKLFMAGVVPGLILLVLFAIYVSSSTPRIVSTQRVAWDERKRVTRRGIGVLLLPIVIIGAIYTGLFTPTEVAALSVVYVVVLGLLQRKLSL
ncbi:MAG: TRAP transporter large permease subunit, partial [Deltaproteobacteria bacterium]